MVLEIAMYCDELYWVVSSNPIVAMDWVADFYGSGWVLNNGPMDISVAGE